MRQVYCAPIAPVSPPEGFGAILEAHWHSLRDPARRTASLAAWTLLRMALRENGVPMGKIGLSPSGKPAFTDEHIHFSLAHDETLCAVSLSDAPTGVDVEPADRHISPALCRHLGEGDPVERWCAMEAFLKRNGEGWTRRPDNIIVPEDVILRHIMDAAGREHVIAALFDGAEGIEWRQRRIDQ